MSLLLQRLLLILLFLWSPTAANPLYDQLQQQLEDVEQSNDPVSQQLEQLYQQTLRELQKIEQYEQQIQSFQQDIDDYPERSEALRQQHDEQDKRTLPDISDWSLERVDKAISDSLSQQVSLNEQLKELQQDSAEISDRTRSFVTQLLEARTNREDVQRQLSKLKQSPSQDELYQARLVLSEQESLALKTLIRSLELEQISSTSRQELLNQAVRLVQKQQSFQVQRQNQLKRRQEQLRAQQVLENEPEAPRQSTDPLVLEAAQLLKQYAQRYDELGLLLDKVQREQVKVTESINRYSQMRNVLKEQLQWLRVSRAYGQTLRQQISELPPSPSLQSLEETILNTRFERFEYQQQLEQLSPRTELTLSSEELNAIRQDTRKLLREMIVRLDRLGLEQVKLKVSTDELIRLLEQMREEVSQELFWIPDFAPISLEFLALLNQDLAELFEQQPQQQLKAILRDWGWTTSLTTLAFVVILVYFTVTGYVEYQRYLRQIKPWIGKVTKDKYRFSVYILLLGVLLTIPVVLLLASVGWLLQQNWQYPLWSAIGSALLNLTPALMPYLLFWNLAKSDGLLITHLNFSRQAVRRFVSLSRLMILLLTPAYLVILFGEHYQERSLSGALSRGALLFQSVIEIAFYIVVFREQLILKLKPVLPRFSRVMHLVILPALVLSSLLTAIAVGWGYYTVALSVTSQIDNSIRLGLLFILTYFLIHRFMLVQERRLAFEQAKLRRAKQLEQREREKTDTSLSSSESSEGLEEPEIDLDTIRSQSLGLLRALLLLLFLLTVTLLWSKFANTFAFLDTVTVWTMDTVVNGVEQSEPVTLRELLIALFILVLITIVVRNIKGAMELLLLQHLDITPGTNFAITTLTRYLVLIVGIFYVVGFLGIDWSRAQWLVAALTVGLGFGLQEIIANFVSGLILLFERPIRLGDTVTIRDITGTVTRIQTRATTIIDWDRKEIIVPNKTFITEDFINWSLSDPINRWIGHIELPQQTDVALATQLILQTASECQQVLKSPEPEVYFNAIKDGNLRFEVRLFLADIGHRQPVAHELHSRLVNLLAQNNVNIASPLLNVTVNSALANDTPG